MAKAFSIGPKESKAVRELVNAIPEKLVERLEGAVRQRGMIQFINHDVVGGGTLSTGFSSASRATEAWHDELTNLKDPTDLVPSLQLSVDLLRVL